MAKRSELMVEQIREGEILDLGDAKRIAHGAAGRKNWVGLVHAENVKLLEECTIDGLGQLTKIAGWSNQGKTTLLQVIRAAVEGLTPDMVTKGKTRASVRLKLTDYDITRVLAMNDEEWKQTLMVTGADGATVKDAKALLKGLSSPTTFDPLRWVQLGTGPAKGKTERERQQRNELLSAIRATLNAEQIVDEVVALGDDVVGAFSEINLDDVDYEQAAFTLCEAHREACAQYFTAQNAKAKDAENRLKLVPKPTRVAPKADAAELKAAEEEATTAYHQALARSQGYTASSERADRLRGKIAAAEKVAPKRADLTATIAAHTKKRDDAKFEIESLEKQLRAQREILEAANVALVKCGELERTLNALEADRADLAACEAELSAQGEAQDLVGLEKAMSEAKADTLARREQDAYDEAARVAVSAKELTDRFAALVKLFRDELPNKLLQAADLGIPGLWVAPDKIMIGEYPLSELNTGAQIPIGIRVAAALNPECGFVLLDRAESLDPDGWKAVMDTAIELDKQVIASVVDPNAVPGDGTVVMRQGKALTA